MLSSVNQLEHFLKEEIWISNRNISKTNRGSCPDRLILDLKLIFELINNVSRWRQILKFSELSKAQAALDFISNCV